MIGEPSPCEHLDAVQDAAAKAAIILRFNSRSVRVPAMYERLTSIVASQDELLVKFAAAYALAHAALDAASALVVPIFLTILQDAKPLVAAYKPIALRGYDALDEVCICLCLTGKAHEKKIIPALQEALDKYTGHNAIMMAHAILFLALQGEPVPAGKAFGALNPHQQEGLRAIVRSRRAWRYSGNLAESLGHFGLPQTRELLSEFIGLNAHRTGDT